MWYKANLCSRAFTKLCFLRKQEKYHYHRFTSTVVPALELLDIGSVLTFWHCLSLSEHIRGVFHKTRLPGTSMGIEPKMTWWQQSVATGGATRGVQWGWINFFLCQSQIQLYVSVVWSYVVLSVVCSVPVLCCSTSQPCWSAVCQLWSHCWSQSRWACSVSVPVESRCCQTGTPCSTTPVQTTSTHCTAPRRLSSHCKYT